MPHISFGTFSYHYGQGPLEEIAGKIRRDGFESVQLSRLPVPYEAADESVCKATRQLFENEGVSISNFFVLGNLSHPDEKVRRLVAEQIKAICRNARHLGTDIVSTMPGSLHPDDEWLPHPENFSQEAFDRLLGIVKELADYAAGYDVRLCFEPFFFSVANTAGKMKTLMDEAGPNVCVMYDPAATIGPDRKHDAAAALREDFAVLGDRIAVVHVEDLRFDGESPSYVLPGKGIVDFAEYYRQLHSIGWNGPFHLEIFGSHEEQRRQVENGFREADRKN